MSKKIKNVKLDNEQTKIKRNSTVENREFLLSLTDEEFNLVYDWLLNPR